MADQVHRDVGAKRWLRVVAALVAVGAALGAATIWFGAHGPREVEAPNKVPASRATTAAVDGLGDYVGSAVCATCHADVAEAYASHPMSRSITRVGAGGPENPGPGGARVAGNRRVYDVEFRDGLMFHHDRMFDAEGGLIYDQSMPVDYVVGSGRRAKAYLHRRGELLFMSPLNWYAASDRWDLAPGYVPDDPRRFGRRIKDDCLACHAGRVAAVGKSLDRYEDPPFHEMAIGCENCHGPGERHVAFHSAGGARRAKAVDPIVNPANLDHGRRESVCYQCHLQAEARVLRPGRGHLDFRPGQALREVWTVLDRGSEVTSDGRTKSVNHVQQMRESLCYRESEGRMGCVSCHDPHRVPADGERLVFYRDRCLTCHDDASCSAPRAHRQAKGDSCVACHMPARDSSNVSHVTQTDHRVPRTPSAVGDPAAEGEPDSDVLAFFDDADRRLPERERNRALGLGAWARLSRTDQVPPMSLARFLDGTLGGGPDDGQALLALGAMASGGGRTDLARSYYERARRIPATEEPALSGLLDIYYAAAEREKALDCADRLIEIDPWDARSHAVRADLLASLGRSDDGIAAAERAIELDPTLVPVRQWLVEALRSAGRDEERIRQEVVLERMRDARAPEEPNRGGSD